MQQFELQLRYISYWRIETWTFIVAAIALLQPWCIAVYKRLVKAGKIDIYETASPEIGFSAFGPTIGLFGTLRARDRELFIRIAELEVLRIDDKWHRQFDWIAFRPLTTVVGRPTNELEVTLPASFMINPSQPHPYNILFSDPEIRGNIQTVLIPLKEQWTSYLFNLAKIKTVLARPVERQQAELMKIAQEAFTDFARDRAYSEALERLHALFPWRPGTYAVTLIARTAEPTRVYRKSWYLQLTEDDQNNLKLNGEKTLQELCLETAVPHNFAYPKYLQPSAVKALRKSLKVRVPS
ncbi:MAG TPA: hypothetical protein VKB02_16500 [Pyrinomonadaceae bacterium]|nr:hypothetical protein [Pyrinomonadaceae bacterium]